MGRRILKRDTGVSFATTLYYYDGWHDVEEAGGVVIPMVFRQLAALRHIPPIEREPIW